MTPTPKDDETEDGTPMYQWMQIVTYLLRNKGYEGEIHNDYFRYDYNDGLTADDAANNFLRDIK